MLPAGPPGETAGNEQFVSTRTRKSLFLRLRTRKSLFLWSKLSIFPLPHHFCEYLYLLYKCTAQEEALLEWNQEKEEED